ncbi:hypothetical protein FFZ96_02095 [Leptospira borgpetersenii]|nr:hypothetical protein LBHB_17125 [Leptospira borgpetersenii serovar Hardjo]TQE59005.1 hypothetical protein FFZ96_02095 [Leptospira borgpetersenii]
MGKYVYKEFVFFSKQVKINFYQNGNIRTCPKLSSVGAALPCKVLSPLNVGEFLHPRFWDKFLEKILRFIGI